MKINVGNPDRILRVAIGLALIAAAAFDVPYIGAWGYIGVVPLLTGLFGICPAYSIFGFNSCPIKNKP